MTKGVLPIYAMHLWLTVGVALHAEGFPPIPVRLHLLGIEGLNSANRIFHLLNHVGAVFPVVGQEVNHPHLTRFADVQVRCQGSGIATVGVLVRMLFAPPIINDTVRMCPVSPRWMGRCTGGLDCTDGEIDCERYKVK